MLTIFLINGYSASDKCCFIKSATWFPQRKTKSGFRVSISFCSSKKPDCISCWFGYLSFPLLSSGAIFARLVKWKFTSGNFSLNHCRILPEDVVEENAGMSCHFLSILWESQIKNIVLTIWIFVVILQNNSRYTDFSIEKNKKIWLYRKVHLIAYLSESKKQGQIFSLAFS